MGAHRLDGLKARRILGGFTVPALAKAATCSDETIKSLEDGGTCDPNVSARLLNALAPAVSLTSNSQANPSVITTAVEHTFQTGDTVTIAGVAGSSADINGSRVVTRVDATSFSVPVDASSSGGTGGTATATTASIGLVSLV